MHLDSLVDVRRLVSEFRTTVQDLGEFERVDSSQLPGAYRRLLDHNSHMMKTLESYYGCSVQLKVLERHFNNSWYCLQTQLSRTFDGQVVQFGILKINVEALTSKLKDDITQERIPLGQVLEQNHVLRRLKLFSLWRVQTGSLLKRLFELPLSTVTYGRTAVICFAGNHAVELLEIVAPHDGRDLDFAPAGTRADDYESR